MAAADDETTCETWLRLVQPHLPRQLISPAVLAQLRSAARFLPGTAINALEARLGADAPRLDLSLGIERRDDAAAMVGRLAEPDATLFARWARGDPTLAPVHALWLEYDLVSGSPGPPQPLICAKLYDKHDATWLADTLLPCLLGAPLSTRQRDWVSTATEALPSRARVLYAFSLRPRRASALRLELFGLEADDVIPYLRQVAPQVLGDSIRLATHHLAACDRLHLSLDFDTEVAPRVGLEGGFARLPHREPGWRRLFDRLVTDGLCTPAKRHAVFTWPGYDTQDSLGRAWPRGASPQGYLVRSLSHVKLVAERAQPLTAKVYLLFQYLPGRPNATQRRPPSDQAASTNSR